MADADEIKAFVDQVNRDHAVDKAMIDLHTAKADRNGLYVWSAYLHCRRAGAPLPAPLLKALDSFAARLLRANSEKEIAEAMNMATQPGNTALRRKQRRDKTLKAVVQFLKLRDAQKSLGNDAEEWPLIEAIANQRDLDAKSLRREINRWEAAERQRQQEESKSPAVRSVFDLGGSGSLGAPSTD